MLKQLLLGLSFIEMQLVLIFCSQYSLPPIALLEAQNPEWIHGYNRTFLNQRSCAHEQTVLTAAIATVLGPGK